MPIITPMQIQKTDRLVNPDGVLSWTATGDAGQILTIGDGVMIRLPVQYPDGGMDWRYWKQGNDVYFTATTDPDPVTGKSVRTLRLIEQGKN